MELHIKQMTPDYLEFHLGNVDNSFANGLRRVMLAEVPMIAIDEVTIFTNTSVTNDEMISHRLGLVPILSTAAKEMNCAWNCSCLATGQNGCTRCTIEMRLTQRCGIDENERKPIYASHIEVLEGPFKDFAYPVHDPTCNNGRGVWLCTLGPGQEIDILCKVRKGIGKEHAKWMPVATAAMQYVSDIRLNLPVIASMSIEDRRAYCNVCPTGVLELEETTGRVIVKNPERCVFCNECVEPDKWGKEIAVVKRKMNGANKFYYVFRIEGIGVLPVIEILREAVAVLKHKLEGFNQAVQHEAAEEGGFSNRPLGGGVGGRLSAFGQAGVSGGGFRGEVEDTPPATGVMSMVLS